ncbi:hypothetical protein W823_15090 [Williamsia sp. D3]|nr:hypothetical protein W823_15090 [Williamsia sp. D3]
MLRTARATDAAMASPSRHGNRAPGLPKAHRRVTGPAPLRLRPRKVAFRPSRVVVMPHGLVPADLRLSIPARSTAHEKILGDVSRLPPLRHH